MLKFTKLTILEQFDFIFFAKDIADTVCDIIIAFTVGSVLIYLAYAFINPKDPKKDKKRKSQKKEFYK